jgi:outer membrane protein assembly factor BamB
MGKIAPDTLCIFIALLLITVTAQAQNWPQWRGPGDNGIAERGNYPVSFSETEGVLWKAELPGKGGSTPIVWGDRIILTSAIGEGPEGEDGVLCFDWNGNCSGRLSLANRLRAGMPGGPAVIPLRLLTVKEYLSSLKAAQWRPLILMVRFSGKRISRRLTYRTNISGISVPVRFLSTRNVVIAVMHEGSSYLLALDQATGNVVWKADRNYTSGRETPQSYTTPLVIKEGNRTTIVVWGADHLTGHDAATGKMVWSYGGFNPEKRSAWRTIASPAIIRGSLWYPTEEAVSRLQ